ncbi:MAG: Rrf2 family transcriptional regulator, partial [Candidatus Omnitrophica bacterium]|nr:Rrf2 family transcriptional regulator [Candidatus Omnitrophota bacterium]
MKISKQGEYGLRAMLYLALQKGVGVASRHIAQQEKIPVKFLEQVLGRLRKAGLLISQKGAAGGYRLAKPADQITLAEVIRAIDGPLAPMLDAARLKQLIEKGDPHCGLYNFLLEVRDAIAGILDKTTLIDVVRKTEKCHQEKKEILMYH